MEPYVPQGIDPALLQRQAQGMQAQQQLSQLLRGPQMEQAYADKNAALQGIRGGGVTAMAANPLEVFANIVQRRRGATKAKELEAQADTLRGNISEGRLAELQASDAGRVSQQQLQLQIQRAAAEERAKREDARKYELRENYQPWVNEQGDVMYLAASKGKGMLDEEGNQVTDLEGFKPMGKNSVLTGIGSKQQQKVAAKSYATLRTLGEIQDVAASLGDEDVALLDRQLLDVAVKGVPGDLETYVRENKINLTPEAKRYLNKVNLASARLRHGLFGSALTRMESSLSNAFIPGAAGSSLQDTLGRIHSFAEDQRNVLAGIEDAEMMRPGTLTNRITYDFRDEISPPKQQNTGSNIPALEDLPAVELTEQEMQMTDEQLDAAIQAMMSSLQGG